MYEQAQSIFNSCRTLENIRVPENIIARRDEEQKPIRTEKTISSAQCQNGVCSLNWKPKRPA
jgi:hypothetical protein